MPARPKAPPTHEIKRLETERGECPASTAEADHDKQAPVLGHGELSFRQCHGAEKADDVPADKLISTVLAANNADDSDYFRVLVV